jgi:hypothetical protein
MKQTFELIDNKLCLKTYDTLTDEPLAIVSHYPFFTCHLSDMDHLVGQPAYSVGNGVYAAHVSGQALEFRLESGGQTLPIKFEKIPIEQPKSKRRTRWYNGGWQAMFATGWRTI